MVVGQNCWVSHREAEVVCDEAYEPRLVSLPICPDYEAPRHAIAVGSPASRKARVPRRASRDQ